MADQAIGAVVITKLKVAFLKDSDDDRFCPCHLPVSHMLLQMAWRTSTTSCPPCVISSAGTLSTPAAFPHFSVLMADSTSCLRIGNYPSSVGSWQISTLGSLCSDKYIVLSSTLSILSFCLLLR